MSRASPIPPHVARLVERWGLKPDLHATKALIESRNYTLVVRDGPRRFLLKAGAMSDATAIDFEAGLLPQLGPLTAGAPHAPRTPTVHAAAPGVLVLDWVAGKTLATGVTRPRLERDVGRALATVHARTRAARLGTTRRVQGTLAQELVWTSPELFAAFSPATARWWHRVQDDASAMEALARLVLRETREPQVLVHGDARRANVIAGARVGLVDWEQAGFGDGARDLGLFSADDVALHLERKLSAGEVRRRLWSLFAGYLETAEALGYSPGPSFLARVVAWTGEGVLRRVWTRTSLEHVFTEREAVLVESACDCLRNPSGWVRQFWRPA